MSDQPIRLAVRTPLEQRQAQVIERLEDLLAQAKRGEVETLLVLWEEPGYEGLCWGVSGTPSLSTTIGRIEILKTQLMGSIGE